mmetsp:Transcript_11636/g.17643  ORF Transcript_11636/g.17643 Transcript_11636/m.17643 type:complete len:872 (+) Transcript_11636:223-2838(+)
MLIGVYTNETNCGSNCNSNEKRKWTYKDDNNSKALVITRSWSRDSACTVRGIMKTLLLCFFLSGGGSSGNNNNCENKWKNTKVEAFVFPTHIQPLAHPRSSSQSSSHIRVGSSSEKLYQREEIEKSKRLIISATVLAATATATAQSGGEGANNDTAATVSLVNDFKPSTMTLANSMIFFVKYLVKQSREARLKEFIMKKSKNGSKKMEALFKKSGDNYPNIVKRLTQEIEEEQNEKKPMSETIRRLDVARKELTELVGYDAALLVPCFGFAGLAAFMNSVIPHYYGLCINCLANTGVTTQNQIVEAITGLAGASLLCAVFTGARGALFWLAGSRANYNVRVKLHRNLLLQEAAFFDSNETGYLLSRLNNDVNKIGMVISFHVNVVFRQFAQLVFGAIYLCRTSRPLAFASFVGIGLVAIVSAIYGNFSRRLAESVQDTFADASAVAETSFSMSETVRAFDGVHSETMKYEASQMRALELEEVQAWAYGSHKIVSDFLEVMLRGGLLFFCWKLGRSGGLAIDKLTTFMFYVNFVLDSSNEMGDQWAKIQSAIGASSNVFDMIRRVPSIRDPSSIGAIDFDSSEQTDAVVKENQPIIEISNMTVTYGAMEAPALKNINLNIHEGDRVAIVGRSGSGKSSLLRTLLRFYDPSSGFCKLEGISLTEITRKGIASKISVVEQEPHLFPMTLLENVLYGIDKDAIDESGEATYSNRWRDEVSHALELAGLPVNGRFKNDLGLELDTRVGEGGRTLSGGQRQRVAIARSLIRKPDVLLLDEPTAALDSQSEKTVVAALNNAMRKTKSMLMVTHRLGVIRSLGVNKVVVLERGKIAEVGDPEVLLNKKDGLYSQLAREQGITPLSSSHDLNDFKPLAYS